MSDPILDPTRLERLHRLGGRDLVLQLIETFADAAPARRAALELALANRDLAGLADAAHSIVAGAGQLGATALSADSRAMEEAARRGDADTAVGRTPGLLVTYDAALAALHLAREAQ